MTVEHLVPTLPEPSSRVRSVGITLARVGMLAVAVIIGLAALGG